MKTKITFELEGKTYIKIMRAGKQIGQIWSEKKGSLMLPYPHGDKDYCHNSIQLCGFDKLDGPWACGPFRGKRDLVVHFRDDSGEYMQQKAKEYGEYVMKFFETRSREIKASGEVMHYADMEPVDDLAKLKNFDDWFRTAGI